MTKRGASSNGTTIRIAPASPALGVQSTSEIPDPDRLREGLRACAIYTLDRGGRIMTWNSGAERLMGHDAWEIVGKHFSIFYAPEDDAAAEPTSHLLAAVDGPIEYETWRVRKDRTRFWASVLLTPQRNRSGDLQGFVKLTRDLTGSQRKQEELPKSLAVEEVPARLAPLSAQVNRTLESALAPMRVHIEALRRTITTLSDEGVAAKLDMLEWGLDRLARSVGQAVKLAEDISAGVRRT